jgi:hypothetical protein
LIREKRKNEKKEIEKGRKRLISPMKKSDGKRLDLEKRKVTKKRD